MTVIILESWIWILFNRLFYDGGVVSAISVKNNFRRNVITTFTNCARKRKLNVIPKRQVICSVCRTINGCECMVFIKVLLKTYLLLKPGFSDEKRTINRIGVDLELSWLKAKWMNSELVWVKKTKFLCSEIDFHQSYKI